LLLAATKRAPMKILDSTLDNDGDVDWTWSPDKGFSR
jgi:hypothetical protein